MDYGRRLQYPEPGARRRLEVPGALRDSRRLVLLGGLLIMAAGALFPWIRAWLPGRGFNEVSGFELSGDAGPILALPLAFLRARVGAVGLSSLARPAGRR